MARLLARLLFLIGLIAQAASASQAVEGVRLWAAPESTRLVFDTSGPVEHRVFSLDNPARLVIDIHDSSLAASVKKPLPIGGMVKGIRSAQRDNSALRFVLDLSQAVKIKTFPLKPNQHYGHRLVVDLIGGEAVDTPAARPVARALQPLKRELIIAIDAGHGGEDPGAKGRRGTREKDVVLSISKKLAALVNREPGMRAVLIREGDYFLPLRKRMQKARRANADMFISIHADAFHDRRARGSSVFVVSQRGASSEMARWLAARENASDLVGGVSLDDKDDLLKEVLLDLAQTATRQSSVEAASYVFTEMKKLGKTHKKRVQKAGFMVLKSPDIPSMLVETAFISNPTEEKRLRSQAHQHKIARAIMKGVRRYFKANPLPGLRMAGVTAGEHVVKPGDTLGHIAQRYGVSLKSLRAANQIKGNRLLVGKVLKIPGLKAPLAQAEPQLADAATTTYRVRKGDTLGHIARRLGVSQKALREANQIRGNRLLAGKVLHVPATTASLPRQATAPVQATVAQRHRVRRGDTLSQIAQRYGVSLRAIRAANRIRGDRLLVGKMLKIPAGDTFATAPAIQVAHASPRKHKVRNGDTLSHIAQRYGVTQRAIRSANKIRGDRLLIGKVLTIPAQDS